MSGAFLAPASAVLEGEDFIGDTCMFSYKVEKHRLHAGRNFGRIYLRSPYQEIQIPVEIVYRRRSDGRARQERESRRALIEIMRHYERLHIGWAREAQGLPGGIDNGEWLRQADELVKRLSFLRRDSILPRLYAAQLLLIGRGYRCGPCGADGDFGPATYGGACAFQRGRRLEPDGVIGPLTWRALLLG